MEDLDWIDPNNWEQVWVIVVIELVIWAIDTITGGVIDRRMEGKRYNSSPCSILYAHS